MNVRELIAQLQQCDPEAIVIGDWGDYGSGTDTMLTQYRWFYDGRRVDGEPAVEPWESWWDDDPDYLRQVLFDEPDIPTPFNAVLIHANGRHPFNRLD